MKWHVYEIGPIDFGWSRLSTVAETAAALGADEARARAEGGELHDTPSLEEFLSGWGSAKDAASKRGWEGDFRDQPVVMWLPDDTEFSFGFVIKQDNNGTTYVVSPHPLPWVEALE
jgi:hypothetical protein